MIEYVPWYQPGAPLRQCLACGAAVVDEEQHTKWHEGLSLDLLCECGHPKSDHKWNSFVGSVTCFPLERCTCCEFKAIES